MAALALKNDWAGIVVNGCIRDSRAIGGMDITFRASKLRFDGDRLAGADGELPLLGVTRPVSLEVSLWKCGLYPPNRKQACGAEAGTRIRRSEFGMTGSLPGVADEVRIAIQIEAFRD